MEENTKKEIKTVAVLVDLLGYGVVELTVNYSLGFTCVQPGVCNIECHIGQNDQVMHSWLYSPDFKLVFSEIGQGKGHAVCFSGEGLNKNVYYQTMLNVVSDYIFLKEKVFR
ncbi:hypothetical protein [Pedobacter sp. UBA5917]|jgi:hypothetical protein|uniref:hypothetical protein n=1 Tax=Pedobacter sp. UBA5917 TaxID=1947061 RepID=UPI0025EA0E1F|nr:hypothetical protein [Pedobacter sp. UBA5917]